ncbi:hypothetical protein, partial [Caldibacillus thermoamylovorans]|uniref:hypothetical protein n=1 Tax=Caldibacillus thermoamylovorans TaxID=35841 RepID=UPI001F45F27B
FLRKSYSLFLRAMLIQGRLFKVLEKANRFFFVRCLFEEANLFSLRGAPVCTSLSGRSALFL